MKPSAFLSPSIAAASLGLLIAAWGGGGGGTTPGEVGGGGTGFTFPTISAGPVNGFGSVVVGDVRFDDSTAVLSVLDGDDVDNAGNKGLKLGMQVKLEGELNKADTSTGKANRIEMHADIRGPVEQTNNKDRFDAMGLSVRINSGTVFEGVKADLSDLGVNDNMQVHGLYSDGHDLVATRVQKRSACSTDCVYKAIGEVELSTTTQLALHGGMKVNITPQTTLTNLTQPIPVGTIVRVKSTTAPVSKEITALSISAVAESALSSSGKAFERGQVEGIVMNLAASSMTVSSNAITLNASTVVLPSGAVLALGQRVKVAASWVNNALVATTIIIDSSQSGSGYTFIGPITNYVSAANLQVKGQQVDASGATVEFRNGTVADLANGRNVEVRGQIVNGTLIANRVIFK